MFTKNKKALTTFQQYTAFTLAEVLITLMIIGVVAAMTIPGFIAEHQQHVYVTTLKKAYAMGNQALQKAARDNCGNNSLDCLIVHFAPGSYQDKIGTSLADQYNVTKTCSGINIAECYTAHKDNYDGVGSANSYSTYAFTTVDGLSIGYENYGTCETDTQFLEDSPLRNICAGLYIDVNGLKGPNAMGKDTFAFYVTSNKVPLLVPMYSQYEDGPYWGGDSSWWAKGASCTKDNKDGWGCAARIMEEGWEMTY